MDYLEIHSLLSVAFTYPQLTTAAIVSVIYGPRAWSNFKAGTLGSAEYLLIGIVLGEIFNKLDQGYWFWPWNAKWYGWASEQFLFDFGVVTNLYFRNLGGIIASSFHLIATIKAKVMWVRIALGASWLAGVAHGSHMYFFKFPL